MEANHNMSNSPNMSSSPNVSSSPSPNEAKHLSRMTTMHLSRMTTMHLSRMITMCLLKMTTMLCWDHQLSLSSLYLLDNPSHHHLMSLNVNMMILVIWMMTRCLRSTLPRPKKLANMLDVQRLQIMRSWKRAHDDSEMNLMALTPDIVRIVSFWLFLCLFSGSNS